MRKIGLLLLVLLLMPCVYAKNNDDTVFLDAKDTSINLVPDQTQDGIKNISDITVNSSKKKEKLLLNNKVEVPLEPVGDPTMNLDPDQSMPVDPVRALMDYGARLRF